MKDLCEIHIIERDNKTIFWRVPKEKAEALKVLLEDYERKTVKMDQIQNISSFTKLPIHERLKKLRTQMNLSQEELARATGVQRSNLASMEKNLRGIPVESAMRLAAVFGIDPKLLIEE